MVPVVPARIENGHIVPETPLPAAPAIRSVTIILELADSPVTSGTPLSRLLGILNEVPDLRSEYTDYLEKKYQ